MSFVRRLGAVSALLVAAVAALHAPALAKSPPRDVLTRWYRAATDSTKADSARTELRKILMAGADSTDVGTIREYLVYATITLREGSDSLLAVTREALDAYAAQPLARASLATEVANELRTRGQRPDEAMALARGAVTDATHATDRPKSAVEARAMALDAVGRLHTAAARHDSAVVAFTAAAESSPANPELLTRLGAALEAAGREADALGAYVRSAGVFASQDTSAREPLARLWAKRGGAEAGLAAAIDSARAVSRRFVAFESRRHEGDAPAWELPDTLGRLHRLADYRGKVVVLNFWGSWCPPCRQELPHFQTLYETWSKRGVQFMAINWERPAATPADRVRRYADYLAKNGFTFPTVLDHDRKAVEAYGLEGYPSTYLIDGAGRLRFLNLGYVPGDEEVVAEQIRALVEQAEAR